MTVTLLLAIIAAAAVAITAILWITARELRATLQRVNRMVSAQEATFQEARRVSRHARHMMARADRLGRRIDAIIGRVCDVAAGAMNRVAGWQEQVGLLWSEHVGNGTARSGGSRRRSH